jgi:hypothetical protein
MERKKKRIWIQPLAVKGLGSFSEPFGFQKRVHEVGEQQK